MTYSDRLPEPLARSVKPQEETAELNLRSGPVSFESRDSS